MNTFRNLFKVLLLCLGFANLYQVTASNNLYLLLYPKDSLRPITDTTIGEYPFFPVFPMAVKQYLRMSNTLKFSIKLPHDSISKEDARIAVDRISYLVEYMKKNHSIDISNRIMWSFETNFHENDEFIESNKDKFGELSHMTIEYDFSKCSYEPILSDTNHNSNNFIQLKKNGHLTLKCKWLLKQKIRNLNKEVKYTGIGKSFVIYLFPDTLHPLNQSDRAIFLTDYLYAQIKVKDKISIRIRNLNKDNLNLFFPSNKIKPNIVGKYAIEYY